MRSALALLIAAGVVTVASTQPPPPGGGRGGQSADPAAAADKLLAALDADKDGKITRAELTDDRFKALFDRADTDKDGVVTRAELVALFTKEASSQGGGRGGPGGPGGPPGGMRGGPGGPGGMPQPGQVLPTFLQDQLDLTADQKQKLAALQKEVDAKLAALLTPAQRKQLDEMRTRGPGGMRGGPGGPGGRPGGPPPGGGPGGTPPGGGN